jgi:hypothetical protein
MALTDYQTTLHVPQTVTSWPDTNTPQMEINRALLRNFYPLLQKLHPTQVPQNSSLMISYQLMKSMDHLHLTTGYLIVVPHATIQHPFSATFKTLKPATYLSPLQMELPRSQLSKQPLIKDRALFLAYQMNTLLKVVSATVFSP